MASGPVADSDARGPVAGNGDAGGDGRGDGADAASGGLRIERVGHDRLGEALRVMADQPAGREGVALSRTTADTRSESAADPPDTDTDEAAKMAEAAEADEFEALRQGLWMALRDDRPTAVVSVQPGAGRTAMVFISPHRETAGGVTAHGPARDAAALVRVACAAHSSERVRLFQALLRPQDRVTRMILEAAGFQFLADLAYMQRRTARRRGCAEVALPEGITLQAYEAGLREEFGHAIEASYQQTLDCPALVGMRQIDDVIDGHMGAGTFREDLWLLIRDHGQPAGVMLLGLVHEGQAAELVYLGLGPSVRGRGLGRVLLEYGLALASRVGAEKMLLAVDQQNTPALRLYDGLRFVPVARRTAMVMGANVAAKIGAKTSADMSSLDEG